MQRVRGQVVSLLREGSRTVRRAGIPRLLHKAVLNWRYPDGPDRLVTSPVFVFSPVRSGSTLLRVILDSHSRICAPHEMHLNRIRVSATQPYLQSSLSELGLTTDELENLLWDRVLHRQLVIARKSIVVDKTPQNLALWSRIAKSWPDARYIFLLRHPASIARSMAEARPDKPVADHERWVLAYGDQMQDARTHLSGPTIRYEDLTADPEKVTREICAWLRVPWEPTMLDYGRVPHGRLIAGIGDWSAKIRSGKVQPARPLPTEVPPRLQELARSWGYS